MSKPDELISKSLEDIDALVAQFSPKGADTIAKGLQPDDVSNDTPADDDQDDAAPDATDDSVDDGSGDDVDAGADDGDQDQDDEPVEDEDQDTQKSITSDITTTDSVKKALEVSEFLRDLVGGLSSVIESQHSELSKSLAATDSAQTLLAKSFEGIAKSQRVVLETQAEILKSVKGLSKRIKSLEEQPVVRKSVGNASQVIDKSFGGTPAATNTLSKSEAVSKLMVGVRSGRADLTQDVLALESVGDLNALSAVGKQFLGI